MRDLRWNIRSNHWCVEREWRWLATDPWVVVKDAFDPTARPIRAIADLLRQEIADA